MIFESRQEAGLKLAERLKRFKNQNPVVLALPRGGVPLGYEIAKLLHAPLDVIVARKIGAPHNPEYGIGAIASGVKVLSEADVRALKLNEALIDQLVEKEQRELERRIKLYRGNKEFPTVENRTVIIVDDGLATGITAKAAVKAILRLNPNKIVLAVPVGSSDSIEQIKGLVDEIACLYVDPYFLAVGYYYRSFSQVSDEEVIDLLKRAQKEFQIPQ